MKAASPEQVEDLPTVLSMANTNSEPTSAVVTFPVASPQSGIQPEPSSNGQGEPKPPSMQALTDEAKQEKVSIYYSAHINLG